MELLVRGGKQFGEETKFGEQGVYMMLELNSQGGFHRCEQRLDKDHTQQNGRTSGRLRVQARSVLATFSRLFRTSADRLIAAKNNTAAWVRGVPI